MAAAASAPALTALAAPATVMNRRRDESTGARVLLESALGMIYPHGQG
jgi:hypothetical protein